MSAGIAVREWRTRRRLSQMELAHQIGVSPRHLSFVETGRANASRALLLRIGEQLDLPLDARNRLLLDGGYAPVFGEHTLDTEPMRPVKAAIDSVLAGHAPYPAVVTDACWNLVAGNVGCTLLAEGLDSELLRPPINVMRLCLHPRGLSRRLLNFAEVHASILRRVRRHADVTAAPDVRRLYEELAGYPAPGRVDRGEQAGELYVPFHLAALDGTELRFVSTIATFGSPLDISVESLAIESFFPADESTSAYLHRLDGTQRLRMIAEQYPQLLRFLGSG
ncbi:helix-turn-helix domain-containing protein [Mycobacterium angelicum]|uniref:Transcriptional regulator n=1 Tax=Mycobacterium angelicum TaxID=470074 RepID=A0A1W9ZUP9_MYCAN|nr:helix-turn-helix transcriptional regulator [Mycobacterium angelicum]MCV7198640.1 helix-turn-helix transcriptional regulator [Mycobacterium angelicum]ORA21519.1 transcriptional regulator [Mycobacterium angelicum]